SAINEGRATDSSVSLRIITNAETTSTAISGAAPAGAGERSRSAPPCAPRAGSSPVGVGVLVLMSAEGGFLPRGPGRPGPGPRGGRVTLRGVGGLRPR